MVESLAKILSSFINCLVRRIKGLDVKSCSDGGKLIEVRDCPPVWGVGHSGDGDHFLQLSVSQRDSS